jgi:APA family basic amino acid/polyamine antiporter
LREKPLKNSLPKSEGTLSSTSHEELEGKLVRAVGLKEIVALTINAIIGAGIFTVPAIASQILGISSPIAFLIAGIFTMIIVLCFCELGGLFDRTGGAYLYAQEAFGGIWAFLIGWMYFLARVTSIAALTTALIGFLGYFFNTASPLREIIVVTVLGSLGLVNYRGIRFSTRVINLLTIAKLASLLIFIIGGILFLDLSYLKEMRFPPMQPLTQALLLVIFVFSGFEVIAIPGAEIIRPKRNLPVGILTGTLITITVYLLIQIVAVGAYPALSSSKRPLADAAHVFLGTKGATLMSAGAVCSTVGTLASLLLGAPRILFAMALNNQMPAVFAGIHPKYRTPAFSIVGCTVLGIAMTLSGTFTTLATLSAMARLMTYIGSALALIVLRKKIGPTDSFRIPGGPLVPVLTVLLSLFLLTAATKIQWITGSAALGAGFILYKIGQRKVAASF